MCDVIAAYEGGLSNREIDAVLERCGIDDPHLGSNKRSRLYEALRRRQEKDRCGNHVIAFIQKAMEPVLWIERKDWFEQKRQELNKRLGITAE